MQLEDMDNGRTEATFLWVIENYSFHGKGRVDSLYSPYFTSYSFERTKWNLVLFPRGWRGAEEGFVSFHLRRRPLDSGPDSLTVMFELSILAEDGSVLESREYEHSFERMYCYGDDNFLRLDESTCRRNFPTDVLTVRCRMWRGDGEVRRVSHTRARTRIGVKTISFVHEVDHFTTLDADQKNTLEIPPHLENKCFTSSNVYFTYDACPAGMMVSEITQAESGSDSDSDTSSDSDSSSDSERDHILCVRKIHLLSSSNQILCAEDDNRFDVERRHIRTLPLSLTRQEILNKKTEYLPDDKLSLLCECIFSCRRTFSQIEEIQHEMLVETAKERSNSNPSKNVYDTERRASAYPSALEDMKSLYLEQCLTDVELKTGTKSFPAHKSVLCARSPVFRRMLTSDMREKNTDRIQIDDLEDDVVHQLLLFLYSDSVQDLEWAMVTRLYYAADKYQVEKLKAICSSFLLEHLSPTNAGELLLLADTHGDAELKGVVEEFILEHEKEVFVSKEWKLLMETHPVLAMKAMYLKYER